MKHKKLIIMIILLGLILPFSFCFAQNNGGSNGKDKYKSPVEIEKNISTALKSGKILLNFEDVDVKVLAKIISEITGKNIIVDDRIQGKITIVSATEVTPAQAWKIFVSAVQTKGFSVVDKGNYVKILPEATSKTERMKLEGETTDITSEDIVVAVIILKNADAEKLKNSLTSLISPNGSISAYEPTNSIVISDLASNVKRLMAIIKNLDIMSKRLELRVYNPKNVSVEPLVLSIQRTLGILDDRAAAGANLKISAYKPTNSILVYGTKQQILQVEKILRTLDKVQPEMEQKFKIYYLENGTAEDIAKTLSEMLSEKSKVDVAEQKGASSAELIAKKVSADKATNALILYVTDAEYDSLLPLIAKLDAPRKQILVSAVVAEVSLRKLMDIGVRWQALYKKGAVGFMGGLSQQDVYATLASGSFILGAMGQGSTTISSESGGVITTNTYPNVFVLLSLLETDSDFNILAAPRLVTADHLEASMNVGSVQPYASGVKFDSNQNPIITYDYKDIGLSLKVTPHISQSQKVRLDINQKIQEITDYLRPTVGQVQYVVPITSQREFKTNVTVEDNQTVIVGGLVSKKMIDVVNKLPILGDIPIIGRAFQNKKTDNEKITLFVFITPHIINNKEDYSEYTKRYQDFLNNQIQQQKERLKKPDQLIPTERIVLPEDAPIQEDLSKPQTLTPIPKPGPAPQYYNPADNPKTNSPTPATPGN